MKYGQRAGSIALAVLLTSATWTVFRAEAQQPNGGAAPIASSTAATVNGEKITRAEVFDDVIQEQIAHLNAANNASADQDHITAASVGALLLDRMEANNGRPVTVTRNDMMNWIFKDNPQTIIQTTNRLIQVRVIQQAARKQGITLSESEIKQRMSKMNDDVRTQSHLVGMSDAQVMAAFGMRPSLLREGALSALYIEKLIRKDIEAQIGHTLSPDDYLDASQILVMARVPQNSTDPARIEQAFAEAKTKIMECLELIKSGKIDFGEAAQDYSDDETKFNNGKLPIVVRGQRVPEFDKVAFEIKPNVLSEPVRSKSGWHLIMVNRRGRDLKPEERQQALDRVVSTKQRSKIVTLMREAKIVSNILPPVPFLTEHTRPPSGGPRKTSGQKPTVPGSGSQSGG